MYRIEASGIDGTNFVDVKKMILTKVKIGLETRNSPGLILSFKKPTLKYGSAFFALLTIVENLINLPR